MAANFAYQQPIFPLAFQPANPLTVLADLRTLACQNSAQILSLPGPVRVWLLGGKAKAAMLMQEAGQAGHLPGLPRGAVPGGACRDCLLRQDWHTHWQPGEHFNCLTSCLVLRVRSAEPPT